MPNRISSSTLREKLRTDGSVAVVLFSGEWCPDCSEFKPPWNRWTADKKVQLYVIEVPRGGPEWEEWILDEIPTVGVFKHGKELTRVHGTITQDDLDRVLQCAHEEPRAVSGKAAQY